MDSTSEILREYLVKLGYQVDAVTEKRFEDHLSRVGKQVFNTGTKIAAVIAAVEAASAKFAYSMRRVYFESELAGTSAKQFEALGYAGKQVGADLQSAAHSMAQALRLNPGLKGLIESLGVKVQGRDISDVMVDFVNATKQMPEWIGAKFAGMFGIDPDTYHQMINHMDELQAKRKQMLDLYKDSGVDPDKAKKTIMEYTGAIDELEARLSILGQAVLIRMQPTFKDVTKFLDKTLQDWVDIANNKRQIILDSFTAKAAAETVKEALQPVDSWIGDKAKEYYSWLANKTGIDKILPRGIRNNNPGNLNYAGQHGATKESGPNGRFAVFNSMQDGLAALADQLSLDYSRGKNSVRSIITKYAPSNENNTKAYIEQVAKSLKVGADDTLNFAMHPEVLKAMMKAITTVEVGSGYINAESIAKALDNSVAFKALIGTSSTRIGANNAPQVRDVKLDVKNEYNITGSDPHTTAKQVDATQKRTYGDVVRNLQGAIH